MKPMHRVVSALVEVDGRFLITQRRPEAVLPLLWEFPGGRVEEGETDEQALVRELRERMAVEATVGALVVHVTHSYAAYDVDMRVYRATLDPGVPPRPVRVHDIRWVAEEDLPAYQFPGADHRTVDLLLQGD